MYFKIVSLAIACAILSLTADAAPQAQPVDDAEVEKRACTTGFRNGGFESGSLSPWVCFEPNDNGEASCTIVSGGDNSKHSVQMRTEDPGNGEDNTGILQQTFPICKKGQYNLVYSLYLPKGKNTFDKTAENNPYLYVKLVDPSGETSTMDDFVLRGTSYSRNLPDWTLPANQWNNFTVEFPNTLVGNWVAQFELNADDPFSKIPTIGVIQIDNVAVTPA